MIFNKYKRGLRRVRLYAPLPTDISGTAFRPARHVRYVARPAGGSMTSRREAGRRSATIGRARRRELANRARRLAAAKVTAPDEQLVAEFIQRTGVTRYPPSACLSEAHRNWVANYELTASS